MKRSQSKRAVVLAAVAASLTLGACTASRYQISDALMRYGMDANEAGCAAEFLRGKLSVSQVDRLKDAARYYNGGSRGLTFGDLIRVAGSVRDPDIALQVGASALACNIAADIPIPGL
ncbi:hypothetical protein GCM10011371_26330 [Novosphingobium marinum]|uniref:Lipoprotein n=1 Tax=Novosphingobium marinum TaxID=1514948 RepID=A0A7Y9XUI2_9SPHN|nr:hypothetical protein [Novosphingobium marinum]NYH94752.1 hypothetical protein [Novosphingobium marinum]GGC37544.1 hypothetical protein GCM10011371_26330 [Novosphingobium marinum]